MWEYTKKLFLKYHLHNKIFILFISFITVTFNQLFRILQFRVVNTIRFYFLVHLYLCRVNKHRLTIPSIEVPIRIENLVEICIVPMSIQISNSLVHRPSKTVKDYHLKKKTQISAVNANFQF